MSNKKFILVSRIDEVEKIFRDLNTLEKLSDFIVVHEDLWVNTRNVILALSNIAANAAMRNNTAAFITYVNYEGTENNMPYAYQFNIKASGEVIYRGRI